MKDQKKKILGIFAHPDDESYGPGGTLAKYARAGHSVSVVTLTRGEAGSLGISKSLPPAELANLRTRELRCAAQKLGLNDLHLHHLPDKGLSAIPDDQGMAIIRQEVEFFQPDLVLTFYFNGVSGHPDHIQVAHWCWQTIRNYFPTVRLLHHGISRKQAERITFRKLHYIPDEQIHYRINVEKYLPDKIAAIHCHRSQLELWEKIQQASGGYESYAREEVFFQSHPELPAGRVFSELFPDSTD